MSHLFLSQVILSHLESSKLLMLARGPPIQNLIYCDSVVTTTTVCIICIIINSDLLLITLTVIVLLHMFGISNYYQFDTQISCEVEI